MKCERCGAELVDNERSSWPYCPVCDWCPMCGDTHPVAPDRRADLTERHTIPPNRR